MGFCLQVWTIFNNGTYLEEETICGKICRKCWKSMGILSNVCRYNSGIIFDFSLYAMPLPTILVTYFGIELGNLESG